MLRCTSYWRMRMLIFEAVGLSDQGKVRENNEDAFYVATDRSREDIEELGFLVIVADGMGGHAHGEIASRMTTEVLRDFFFQGQPADPERRLVSAIQAAHERILEWTRQNHECRGMGTTVTAAAFHEDTLYWAHVGDSRLYLLRGGRLTQVSEDHTFLALLKRHGAVFSREKGTSASLYRALGHGGLRMEVDRGRLAMQHGDRILLTTDGVTDMLEDRKLRMLLAISNLEEAARSIVEAGIAEGGFDNITVVIGEVVKEDSQGAITQPMNDPIF
ncbi:MAG: serine/threonine-protein phosphatase [Deltaproteobacteria bacterium]|nr:MAG: serine/threonine-protein phosphatase [Deltaproteobacteria bacterium]